jgi:hypothetical protein
VRSSRYDQSEKGRERTEEFATKKYLTRQIVAIDGEGRCPAYALDAKGRSPLEVWKENRTISPFLKFDGQGNPWEPHEIHLIGAQGLDRPYQTPLTKALRQPAIWLEPKPGQTWLSADEIFDWLLSLPYELETNHPQQPIFVMFAAMYDWTMWQIDVSFGRAYSIVKQRQFEPPCKRRQGYQFLGQWAVQMQPHRKLDIGELRWRTIRMARTIVITLTTRSLRKDRPKSFNLSARSGFMTAFATHPRASSRRSNPLRTAGLFPKRFSTGSKLIKINVGLSTKRI